MVKRYFDSVVLQVRFLVGARSADTLLQSNLENSMVDFVVTSIKENAENKIIAVRNIENEIFCLPRNRDFINLSSHFYSNLYPQDSLKRVPYVIEDDNAINGRHFAVVDSQGEYIPVYYRDHNMWRQDNFFRTEYHSESIRVRDQHSYSSRKDPFEAFKNLPIFF